MTVKLTDPFPPEQIDSRPKGGAMLSYVSHARVTQRLLEVDPAWTWEPVALAADGTPQLNYDANGSAVGLWIRLTVSGVTRLGYGSCEPGKSDAIKELLGDAIRNSAMRFGVALDLWMKDKPTEAEPAKVVDYGPCPEAATCGGHVIRKPRKDKTDIAVCSTQKYDFATRTASGCDWKDWEPDFEVYEQRAAGASITTVPAPTGAVATPIPTAPAAHSKAVPNATQQALDAFPGSTVTTSAASVPTAPAEKSRCPECAALGHKNKKGTYPAAYWANRYGEGLVCDGFDAASGIYQNHKWPRAVPESSVFEAVANSSGPRNPMWGGMHATLAKLNFENRKEVLESLGLPIQSEPDFYKDLDPALGKALLDKTLLKLDEQQREARESMAVAVGGAVDDVNEDEIPFAMPLSIDDAKAFSETRWAAGL